MKNQRVRTIDVEKLSEEQFNAIQDKLVEKLNPIVAKAIQEANRFLEPYGLSAKMAFEVSEKQ
jgi:hypothetical protein